VVTEEEVNGNLRKYRWIISLLYKSCYLNRQTMKRLNHNWNRFQTQEFMYRKWWHSTSDNMLTNGKHESVSLLAFREIIREMQRNNKRKREDLWIRREGENSPQMTIKNQWEKFYYNHS
jgi:hypothetical protein